MRIFSRIFKSKVKLNKIIEVLAKKEKEIERTGSGWDWQVGYPESQWALLCRLENGKFKEDDKNISFYTIKNEEIGIAKNFLVEKTNSKAIYGAPGTVKIEKNLREKDVFEITDRVGNYIMLRVESMYDESLPIEQGYDYKCVRLNGQKLALLYIALSKGLFNRPKKGQIYFESHKDGNCTLYFKRDYYTILTDSMFQAFYQGKFEKGNAETGWNNLKSAIDGAIITEKENVETLEIYGIYDEI